MQRKLPQPKNTSIIKHKAIIQRTTLTPAQIAAQITWELKGALKRSQLSFLHIGKLLVQVRDQKLYAELKNDNLTDYAQAHLGLSKTSLYRFMDVYDWVAEKHAEWLQPKPKGFIPDLSDCADLIWVESQLENTQLDPARRKALEDLDKKGLAGKLQKGEVSAFRHKKNSDGLKSFLVKLRNLRRHGADLSNMPKVAIESLDEAINAIANVL